jgi:hypothetical protein
MVKKVSGINYFYNMPLIFAICEAQPTASNSHFDESLTGWATLALTAITAFLLIVAYSQLGDIKKTSKADFILKFTLAFFGEKNHNLILLCDNFALKYKTKEIDYANQNVTDSLYPYFEVNSEIIEQLPLDNTILDSMKKIYTCYEIDDFLGYFEDIGKFERQGLIAIDNVYNSFSWYIRAAWNNDSIQQYLETQKENEDDFFENFKYIFEKCESFKSAKEK